MFTIDERLRGLPAVKDQVVALHESLNQPHLAIPGRKAGPARCYVLGLRGPQGFAVFVYLYLVESSQCAVYVPQNRAVPSDQYADEESEALSFVESMGFMMDNLNFRGRSTEEADQLLKTLPVFQREPPVYKLGETNKGDAKGGTGGTKNATTLGKLFSAFCLAGLVVTGVGCKHVPSEKERDEAQLHYELAIQAQAKDAPSAMRELEAALTLDPEYADAWHLKAILLHMSFQRLDESYQAYQKVMALKPGFTEAKVNFGNLLLEQSRYDEAIKQYQEALNDMRYATPYFAQGNLGWALYKKGEIGEGIRSIRAAVTTNPKFCLGYKNLGIIFDEQGNLPESCKQYGKYREICTDQSDAYYREAACLAKTGKIPEAKTLLATCQEKTQAPGKDACKTLAETLK